MPMFIVFVGDGLEERRFSRSFVAVSEVAKIDSTTRMEFIILSDNRSYDEIWDKKMHYMFNDRTLKVIRLSAYMGASHRGSKLQAVELRRKE
jgi:hypothetical protein